MSETRWLEAAQQRDWRAYIDGSTRLTEILDRDLKAKHGLTLPEYEILVHLSEAPERCMRMAELALNSNHSRSRLSHTVTRLECKEYVSRCSAHHDKRGVLAQLTDKGFAALHAAACDHVSMVREYFVDLVEPDDMRAVGRAFRAITERIEKIP